MKNRGAQEEGTGGGVVTRLRRKGGREGRKVRTIHTTNDIRDPPRRERRKLPRMKMDCEEGWRERG